MCPMLQSSEAFLQCSSNHGLPLKGKKKKLFLLLRTSFKKLFMHESELEAMYTYAHQMSTQFITLTVLNSRMDLTIS
jgi:hypothetical protein